MKTKVLLIPLVLATILPACASQEMDYERALDEVLSGPTEESFLRWKIVAEATVDDCQQEGGFDNQKRSRLFNLIRNGDAFAAQVGVMSFHCWDGGELGDFYRSAGVFFDQSPVEFMRIVQERPLSDYALERMVSMLPLETVDDIDAQITRIEGRISALRNLPKQYETSTSQHLIQVLEVHKSRLLKHKQEQT